MAEPTHRRTNAAGGKYYDHPITGERFDSVTTALDIVDKARLKIWAAGLAADWAFELLPQMNRAVLEPDCGNTHNQCMRKHGRDASCERCPCGVCQPCLTRRLKNMHFTESSRRAAEGTEVHEAARFWVLNGGSEITLSEAAKPYFSQFLRWTRDYGLASYQAGEHGYSGEPSWEQTETTILNRVHMYAGTSDAAVWIVRGTTPAATEICDRLGRKQRVLIRIDYKTREKPDEMLFNDHPLQLVGYDRCSAAMADDGTEHELPRADACAVLQLRPNDYTFRLVRTDDETFQAFLDCLSIYRWLEGPAKKAMDPEAFPITVGPAPELRPVIERATLPPLVVDVPDLSGWDDDSWESGPAALADAGPVTPAPQEPDPFATHTDPAQVKADTTKPPRKSTPRKAAKKAEQPPGVLDQLRNFSPGQPLLDRLDEPLPF